MPKVFRVMQEESGKPKPGSSATTLGVRVPQDIKPDAEGTVRPGTGGMSVAPRLTDLPYFLVPGRLRHLVPRAGGSDRNFVWSMGSGAFVAEPVASGLHLRPDPDNRRHGFVEPDHPMSLERYQRVLQETQPLWSVDEE